MKKKIVFIIILCIISCGIGVYGATLKYNASEILYNVSDGTSMDVNEALNDLYNNYNNIKSLENINVSKIGSKYLYWSGTSKQSLGTYNLEKGIYLITISSTTTEYSVISEINNCDNLILSERYDNGKFDNNTVDDYIKGRGSITNETFVCKINETKEITIISYQTQSYYAKAMAVIFKIE